jgi:hypothetical protein
MRDHRATQVRGVVGLRVHQGRQGGERANEERVRVSRMQGPDLRPPPEASLEHAGIDDHSDQASLTCASRVARRASHIGRSIRGVTRRPHDAEAAEQLKHVERA